MKWKNLFTALVIVASIVMVCMIAFSNNDLENAWQVLFTLDFRWFLAALGSWFCYLFFDGLSYFAFLRKQGYRIKLVSALYVSIVGFFYANITPGSSGGQPMQAYELNKRCIPVGVGTSALSVRFLMNQFVTVLIALLLIILNRPFVHEQLGSVRLFFILGLVINSAAIPLVLLTVIHKTLVLRLCSWFIRLFGKLRINKDPEASIEKLAKTITMYRTSFIELCKKPFQIIIQFLISVMSIGGLLFVTYFVYRAFGFHEVEWYKVLTVSALLFVSASYTPLPGSSGAQEGGFMLYFRGIIPGNKMGLALLVWRFITYYLFLLIGPIFTIGDSILHSRRIKRIQNG